MLASAKNARIWLFPKPADGSVVVSQPLTFSIE